MDAMSLKASPKTSLALSPTKALRLPGGWMPVAGRYGPAEATAMDGAHTSVTAHLRWGQIWHMAVWALEIYLPMIYIIHIVHL